MSDVWNELDGITRQRKEREKQFKAVLESKDSILELGRRISVLREAENNLRLLGYRPYAKDYLEASQEFMSYVCNAIFDTTEIVKSHQETIVYLIQCGYSVEVAINLVLQ
jgi:hypothetical protein